jgi:ABC-type amino acid transport substrate-binding protein
MRNALLAAALLALSGTASAATLSMVTSTPTRAPGDTLVVTVRGTGFDAGTYGGDFSILFNNNAFQLVSLVVSNPPWDTSSVETASANSMGLIDRVDVFKFAGAPEGPDFDIATLTFNVLAGFNGPTTLTFDASLVGWSQPDGQTAYNLSSSYGLAGGLQISPVPAPPAVWLLATGIAGLIARRKLRAG